MNSKTLKIQICKPKQRKRSICFSIAPTNYYLLMIIIIIFFTYQTTGNAQPQAPITWSEPVPILTLDASVEPWYSVHAKGDTILLLTARGVQQGMHSIGRVSTNAGLTWTPPYYFYDSVLAHQSSIASRFSAIITNSGSIYVLSPLNQWQIAIWRTTNAGQTWIRQIIPIEWAICSLDDAVGDTLFCFFKPFQVGSSPFVAYTTDGGATFHYYP